MVSMAIERAVPTAVHRGFRELSDDELFYVSGGDDGCAIGDSGADGNCAAQGETGTVTGATLPSVTITASPDTIGDAAATNLVNSIDLAFTDPIMALIMFGMTLWGSSPGDSGP
jgi:hypothetical protein